MTMLYVVVAVLLLICIGLSFLARSTWRWYHILLACSVVMCGFAYLVLASKTLDLITTNRKNVERLTDSVERETKKGEILRYGTGRDEDILDCLRGVNGELGRSLMDRGRIWTNVKAVPLDENKLVVDMTGWGNASCAKVGIEGEDLEPEPDAAADGAAPREGDTHGIEQDSIVYLFAETPASELTDEQRAVLFSESELLQKDTEGVCKVPTSYLGDFQVKEVAGASITLEPVFSLDEDRTAALQADTGSWAFYEMMPLDAHDAFGGLTAEQLRTLIPQEGTGLDAARYSKLIDSYVRDQQPAGQGDPPERTMTKVRFLQNETIDVDVDQPEPGVERAFDLLGRAQLPQLRLGSSVEIKSGDEVLFDTVTANNKVRDGKAELVDEPPVYVRQLRDYATEFQEKRYEITRIDDQITRVTAQSEAVIAAAEKANEQIAFRTREKEALIDDLANFRQELAVVKEFEKQLHQRRAAQRAEIGRLYQQNHDLALQLQVRTGQLPAQPPAR